MRKVGWALAIVLMFATGAVGLYNGVREFNDPVTAWQRSVNVAVLCYGVLGLIAAIGLFSRRRFALPATVGWALASMWAGSVASFAFGDPEFKEPGTRAGVFAAAVSILVVGSLVTWIVRDAVSRRSHTGQQPTA